MSNKNFNFCDRSQECEYHISQELCVHIYMQPGISGVPVTTAWCIRSRMEERPPMWRVAANILSKQLQTANKGWFSSLGVGRGANNSSPQKRILLQNVLIGSTCECGNEPSGSIKCGGFLDQLKTGQLLKEDSGVRKCIYIASEIMSRNTVRIHSNSYQDPQNYCPKYKKNSDNIH